jgi:hypothetical protein
VVDVIESRRCGADAVGFALPPTGWGPFGRVSQAAWMPTRGDESIMRYTKLLMLAAALLVLPVRSAHANLITNGSFEDPPIGFGAYALYTSIPGWTATTGLIEIQNHAAGDPAVGAGNQFIELDSNQNSAVSDNGGIATSVGSIYQLSFLYSPRPGVPSTSNIVEVYINGGLLDSLTDNGGSNTNWTTHSYFLLGTASTLIEFRGAGTNDSYGGYVDDVVFDLAEQGPNPPTDRVPEPASMMLTGLGMAATGIARRWRKK